HGHIHHRGLCRWHRWHATLPGDRHDDRLIAANRPGNSTRPGAGVENACRAQARELRSGRVDTAVAEPAGHTDDAIDGPGGVVAARTVARVRDARRPQRIEQPGAWSRVRRTLPRDPALNVEDDVDCTLRIEERDGAVITDRHLNQVWHGLTCDDIEVRGDWRA